MILELIIFGTFLIAAFICGFYFGYLKREDKAPEMPQVNKIIKRYISKKGRDNTKQLGFYGQEIEGE